MRLSRLESGFPQPSGPLEHKYLWFSETDIMGAHVPSTGVLGWGATCGPWTSCSSGGTLVVVIALLLVGHCNLEGVVLIRL